MVTALTVVPLPVLALPALASCAPASAVHTLGGAPSYSIRFVRSPDLAASPDGAADAGSSRAMAVSSRIVRYRTSGCGSGRW